MRKRSAYFRSLVLPETVRNNCILTHGWLSVLFSKQLKQLTMAPDILSDQYLWHRMFISFCVKGGGVSRCRCTFFLDRLDILAITMLLLVAKLFLHRNKSTKTEEVLLVSGRKGRAPCSAPADNGSHEVFTPPYDNVRRHVLMRLRRESVGKGAPSVEERLSDKTLCSRFVMSDLLLFKLCEFSWFKRTVVESSREVGV